MKLVSKNSNLCDHDTSTSRTDGQTNSRSKTALCVASRGKKILPNVFTHQNLLTSNHRDQLNA